MNHAQTSAPWHYWLITIISVMWNAFGGYDYTMSKLVGMNYFRSVVTGPGQAEAMQALLDGFPLWANFGWGLGVWGAVAGSLLLLLRSRFAVPAFVASLAGLALSSVYQWTMDMPAAFQTDQFKMMNLVIWAGALFLLWYAWFARGRGWIR